MSKFAKKPPSSETVKEPTMNKFAKKPSPFKPAHVQAPALEDVTAVESVSASKKERRPTSRSALKIKIINKKNPYKPGTKVYDIYELIKGASTPKDFKALFTVTYPELKYDAAYLHRAQKQGHITIS